MEIDWDYYGKKVYQALNETGAAAMVSFEIPNEDYDIEDGKGTTTPDEYETHAILKNYSVDMKQIVNPEDVEIIFHSGNTADTIPDLMNEKDLKIEIGNRIFEIISIEAVRPAGVTMLYKARAKEYGGS